MLIHAEAVCPTRAVLPVTGVARFGHSRLTRSAAAAPAAGTATPGRAGTTSRRPRHRHDVAGVQERVVAVAVIPGQRSINGT